MMKKLIEWYLIIKLALFCLCLCFFIPLAFVFPEHFLQGIKGFLNRFIDDILKHKIATEGEVKEWRDML